MKRLRLAAAAAALSVFATSAAAQTTAQPQPTSLQATYDAAQAAYDKNDWDSAIAGFSKVLAAMGGGSRSEAIIRIRMAEALMSEQRFDEAQSQASQGVAELRALAAGPDADLADGYETLGDALRLNFAYDDAITAYNQAKTFAAGDAKDTVVDLANVGVIQSAMVTHPDLAVSTADAMIGDPRFAIRSADLRSQIYALRARAELNRGNAKAASSFIDKALALSGALESGRISLSQEEVRSDAALISEKLKDYENVRRYLAYTGAGHLPDQRWFSGADMDSPVCGPDITPDDTAVIEFSIADSGRTAGAAAVYASRPGQMGVAFARAVREWRWAPEAVAASKGFWRAVIRVQMRCALAPPPLSLSSPFEDATAGWLRSKGVSAEFHDIGSPPHASASPDLDAIVALFRALDRQHDEKANAAAGAKLDALLVQAGAPIDARAVAASFAAKGGYGMRAYGAVRARLLSAALPKFDQAQGGQRAAAWLRVEMAIALETAGEFTDAKAPLEAVVALPPSALPSDDPIRTVAILHLSLLDARSGDVASAQALQHQSGLTPQGCNLLDVRPVPTAMATNSNEFPEAAEAWGFEGWVKTGYDIGADGKVKDARALISYPPFVFDDAATQVVSNFRYLPPTLGGAPLSCSGKSDSVQFRILAQ